MILIGTMPTCMAPIPWTKMRFHQDRDSRDPHRDPGDLPAFDKHDWQEAENAESSCFSDVRSSHVERWASDQWALKIPVLLPRSRRGGAPGGSAQIP